MDYSKLRGRIRAYYPTHAAFAKALGVSVCALSQKLNNHSEFTRREMEESARLLHFSVAEIPAYFFKLDVEISQ